MTMVRVVLLGLLAGVVNMVHAADESSYSRPDRVRVSHLRLDLDADFDKRELAGFAELTLDWSPGVAGGLDLDSRDLVVERAEGRRADGSWHALAFRIAARDPVRGQKLAISATRADQRVRIHYRTTPASTGLSWLAPAQTSGSAPMLYSQSEALHARSWVPIQDSPGVRFRFDATVRAPGGMRVLMGAENDPAATGDGGWHLHMGDPIPAYLLAIAIGDFRFQATGPRSGVYAEPARVAAAAREFEDLETMIATAESLYGPYRWGRYDLLVLPPAFPFGGMENPRLTFVNPSLVAGDKSLTNVIAHELAHSWSGNLVTNADWTHFWLNEGFTTYVENRIVEAVFGRDIAEMQQVVDLQEMREDFVDLAPADTRLVPALAGRDPDDIYSTVPYTKGAMFLRLSERRLGRERFDRLLRDWFDRHAFGSATTDDWLAFLRRELAATPALAPDDAEIQAWLYGPLLPDGAPIPDSARLRAVEAKAQQWLAGSLDADALGADAFVTYEWLHFLDRLRADPERARLDALDARYHLSSRGNAELGLRWVRLAVLTRHHGYEDAARRYLSEHGRRKLVLPIFDDLAATPEGKGVAKKLYAELRSRWHAMTQASLDKKLN